MANEVTIVVTDKYRPGGGFAAAEKQASGFGNTMGRVGKSMTDFGARATTRLSLPIVAGFGLAERAATNLGEAQNAANVIFGKAAPMIDAVANISQKLGMSQRQLYEAVTPIGAALQNAGFSAEEAATASIGLTQRAADMASVFNTDVDQALLALQAGLRGEADPLERFGIGLNEAAVQAKAAEMGLGGVTGELSANEKQQARLALIMEQTNKISGDFARTSDSNANQLRIQKAAAEDAAAAFGQGLQPIMQKLLQTGAGLLEWFNGLSPAWQQFIIFAGLALAALGPLVGIVGTLITAIKGVAAAFSFLAANPIVLVIAAVIAVIVLLIIHWDKVKAAALVAWNAILGAARAVWNWLKQNWPLVLAILTGPVGLAVLAIVKHWTTIRNFIAGVLNWMRSAASSAVSAVVSFFTGLPGRIASALGRIPNLIRTAIDTAKDVVRNGVDAIVDFFWSIPERISGLVGSILDKLPSPGGGVPFIPGIAHGGIVGAQSGRILGGAHLVGEHGPELLNIPAGSRVRSNGQLRTMLAQGGGSSVIVNINVAGSIRSDRDLLKLVRDELSNGGLR